MNTSHALGFVGSGLVMLLLPALAPSWVASESIYGPEGRAWWLVGMGSLQAVGGLCFVLRQAGHWFLKPGPVRLSPEVEVEPAPAWARATFRPTAVRRMSLPHVRA